MKPKISPNKAGLIALIAMTLFYYAVLWLITGDYYHPVYFFLEKWYLLTPLILGFGIQIALYQKLRIIIQENKSSMAAASAATSGAAMAACCAHHLAEVFPLLGFLGAASVMTQYQDWFLFAGIVINGIGILYMCYNLSKYKKMACCAVPNN